MQVKNLTVISHDACEFIHEYENSFDAVLCDVPCSGFGVAFENPDIKLNREENDLKSLTTLQLSIIENCSKYLKKGGRLVYSTCSVFAVENDGVVGKFLSNNKDFIVKENPSLLSHEKTKYGMQFLPDISGGGFFVSVMEKV
jgi:16S rRNA (cytosine967-C5)-methyltransferase